MPELPEVETIKNDLKKVILHKKITDIAIHKEKQIKNKSIPDFRNEIINHSFSAISRIGKLIYIRLSNKNYLLIHLKMTGQLIYQKKHQKIAGGHNFPPVKLLPNKYSHVIFSFDDHSQLFFNDQRQFGYLKLVTPPQLKLIKKTYGIEPLQPDFTLKNFQQIFTGKKTTIKNILLNQSLVSGLGNIYVDEICFDAQIRPQTKAEKLTLSKIKKLYFSTEKIIKQAIRYRGTTFSDYVDSKGTKGNYSIKLKVYGRTGEKCYTCKKQPIKKIKINGRGTHFCPRCQK